MPSDLTEANIEKAESAYASMRDNPDGSVSMEQVDSLSTRIREYRDAENALTNTNESGGNIEDARGELPNRWEPEKKASTAGRPSFVGGFGAPMPFMGQAAQGAAAQPEIFHEPSLGKAKRALSDPATMQALGYGPNEMFSPEALDALSEDSLEYRKYADNLYSQALLKRKAASDGVGIVRFSKIGFGEDPGSKVRGAALEYGLPVVSGLDDSAALGAVKAVTELASPGSTESIRDLSERHPIPSIAGNVIGNFLPGGAAARGARLALRKTGYEAAKQAANAANKVITKGMVGRAAASGALVGTLEGEGMDAVAGAGRKLGGGDFFHEPLQEEISKRLLRTAAGAVFGAGGEVVGGLAAKGAKVIAENPKVSNLLKIFREGGGDTSVAGGLKPTAAMQENVTIASKAGPNNEIQGTVEDVASRKLASQLPESLRSQEAVMSDKYLKLNEGYNSSPSGLQKHSTAPVVESLYKSILGKFKSSPLGGSVNQQPTVVREMTALLKSTSERIRLPLHEAQALIEEHPGWIMASVHDAEKVWPTGNRLPTSNVGAERVVFAPLSHNSKSLNEATQHVDSLMRDAKNSGGEKEGLLLVQRGLRKVRDEFGGNEFTPKEATLDDGTIVTGLSALQRKTHEAKTALELSTARLNAGARETPMKRLQSYQQPGTHVDVSEAIKAEAKGLGLESELEDMAGTIAYQKLRGLEDPTSGGVRQSVLRRVAFMADPLLRELGGVAKVARQSVGNIKKPNVTPVNVKKVKSIISKGDDSANRLSKGEVDAIHSYTSRKSELVGTPEWDSAIKKMTVENPTDAGTLYSGTRMPQEKLDEIISSGQWSITKPTSTSYNRGISSAMSSSRVERGTQVLIEYHNVPSGVNLTTKKLGISGTSGEREIMLHSGNYRVIDNGLDDEGNRVLSAVFQKASPNPLAGEAMRPRVYSIRGGTPGRLAGIEDDRRRERNR